MLCARVLYLCLRTCMHSHVCWGMYATCRTVLPWMDVWVNFCRSMWRTPCQTRPRGGVLSFPATRPHTCSRCYYYAQLLQPCMLCNMPFARFMWMDKQFVWKGSRAQCSISFELNYMRHHVALQPEKARVCACRLHMRCPGRHQRPCQCSSCRGAIPP